MNSFMQTVTFWEYSLGLVLRQRAGRFMITWVARARHDSTAYNSLVGWELIAIRRLDGTLFDLVERYPDDVAHLITRVSGPLAADTEVVLELPNPLTLERVTMKWPRYRVL